MPEDFGTIFYNNYKSCEVFSDSINMVYIIDPKITPKIFDSSLDFGVSNEGG
jgi:hypothetical protein